MLLERRLGILEKQIALRCPRCRSELQCTVFEDWKIEARALGFDPDALVENFLHAIRLSRGEPENERYNLFSALGYDLSNWIRQNCRPCIPYSEKQGDSMLRRLARLEDKNNAAIVRWLKSLNDEELSIVAGETTPAEQAFLSSLTNEQLEQLVAGRPPGAVLSTEQLLRCSW